MAMKHQILEALASGPLTDRQIADRIGAPVPSVRRARGELVAQNDVEQYIEITDGPSPRQLQWQLGKSRLRVHSQNTVFRAIYGKKPDLVKTVEETVAAVNAATERFKKTARGEFTPPRQRTETAPRQGVTDRPFRPGSESDREARREEAEKRAAELQHGTKLL